jgi:pyruvate formate lyase activating enzyme
MNEQSNQPRVIQCDFCAHLCKLSSNQIGKCGRRINSGSQIETLSYGRILNPSIDPVEKKPFYHLFPGSNSYSYAMAGCNFKCEFCQNHSLSQLKGSEPSNFQYYESYAIAQEAKVSNCKSIAATYSEPLVWSDYVENVSREAKKEKLITCMVTNGFFSLQSRKRLSLVVDAFNIDLKGDNDFYKKFCGGRIDPVLETLEYLVNERKHVEVTSLYISQLHKESEILDLAEKLEQIGVSVWHISKYHPSFKMTHIKGTEDAELISLYQELRSKVSIPFLYLGNIRFNPDVKMAFNTLCPQCGAELVDRSSYYKVESFVKNGRCYNCDNEIYGIF